MTKIKLSEDIAFFTKRKYEGLGIKSKKMIETMESQELKPDTIIISEELYGDLANDQINIEYGIPDYFNKNWIEPKPISNFAKMILDSEYYKQNIPMGIKAHYQTIKTIYIL